MRLVDLEPAWLIPDMFVFRSPTGHRDLLTCKRVVMSMREQQRVIWELNPQYKGVPVVMTREEMAWRWTGDTFENLSVWPSIDASASGNWHGFIENGVIK